MASFDENIEKFLVAHEVYDIKEQKKASKLIKAFIDHIVAVTLESERYEVPRLGVFKVVNTAARTARNPATGGVVEVPAGKKFKLSPSASIKNHLKG